MDIQDYNFEELVNKINIKIRELPSTAHYDQFFSFKSLGKEEFYNFAFGNDNLPKFEIFKDIGHIGIVKMLVETWHRLNLPSELLTKIFRNGMIRDSKEFFEEKNINEITFYRALIKYILYSTLDRNFEYSLEDLPQSEIDFAKYMNSKNKNKDVYFFRGQSDYSWKIVPSLIRNLKFDQDLYINQNTLYEIYNENGYSNSLLSKYNKCFKNLKIDRPAKVDYRFLAWMQHAVSFSPLVDFTSDYNVALTFALSPSNPCSFIYKDSAIYLLSVSRHCFVNKVIRMNKANEAISKINICLLKSKIEVGKKKVIYDAYGITHTLDFTSCKKISEYILPKFLIIDIPTNDRMKVQKGKFMLFYDCLLINGKMVSPFGDKLENMFHKHRICDKDKSSLLDWLHQNYPEMKESYLMDPYLIFRD